MASEFWALAIVSLRSFAVLKYHTHTHPFTCEHTQTLSVIGVGVTTRVHVAGPLFDDFFYTDRAEI